MKKILSFLLVLMFATSMLACGEAAPNTPANNLAASFKSIVKDDSNVTVEDIALKLAEDEIIPVECGSMAVEPGFLNGFKEEVTGFTAGATFGPYISSMPYIGYVFEVDGDADKFAKELEGKADLRWNVCTEADEMVSAVQGNKVFFVMAPLSFDE